MATIENNGNLARQRPRVIIVGAGFGGLSAARQLANKPVNLLLIDRDNYHLFSPLLYQIAAAEIGPGEIAFPVRKILQKQKNAEFMLAHVREIDLSAKVIKADNLTIPYNYLILATGSATHFFNIPGAAEHSFPLKNMEQAVTLRNHILQCFELTVHERDEQKRKRLLTFVIVGGGPTGVEYAGALSELIYGPLKKDYKTLDLRDVKIILVEGAGNLLSNMPPKLQAYTLKRLREMHVDIQFDSVVSRLGEGELYLRDGKKINSETVVWTAGVMGEPLAKSWGLPVVRNGLVKVSETLQLTEFPEVYVLGDMAYVMQDGNPLPMLAPAAMQQGVSAARNIMRQINGKTPEPFHYKDNGTLATIGRNAAAAHLGRWQFTGYPAWILWVVIHLFKLISFRNRLLVMINWAWDYLFFERALRLIMPRDRRLDSKSPSDNIPAHVKEQIESQTG